MEHANRRLSILDFGGVKTEAVRYVSHENWRQWCQLYRKAVSFSFYVKCCQDINDCGNVTVFYIRILTREWQYRKGILIARYNLNMSIADKLIIVVADLYVLHHRRLPLDFSLYRKLTGATRTASRTVEIQICFVAFPQYDMESCRTRSRPHPGPSSDCQCRLVVLAKLVSNVKTSGTRGYQSFRTPLSWHCFQFSTNHLISSSMFLPFFDLGHRLMKCTDCFLSSVYKSMNLYGESSDSLCPEWWRLE